MSGQFGEIEAGETLEEREIVWKINNFSSLINSGATYWDSPSFSFANYHEWYLHLQYKPSQYPESVNLYLWKGEFTEYSVEYDYGVKRLDGSVEHLGRGSFQESRWSKVCHLMNASEFDKRQPELVISDVLTITCSLKRGTLRSPPSSDLDRSKFKKLIDLETLSKNLKDVFENKENCDTILRVQDKEYNVHKLVLIARSSVFAAMFKHDTKEKQTGVITIPDCDSDSFEDFLEYLYSGKLEEPSSDSTIRLYETSDKYNVLELKAFCKGYLIENLTVENFSKVVIMADKYEEKELLTAAQEFFISNISKIIETPKWEHLMKNDTHLANKLLKEMVLKRKL